MGVCQENIGSNDGILDNQLLDENCIIVNEVIAALYTYDLNPDSEW